MRWSVTVLLLASCASTAVVQVAEPSTVAADPAPLFQPYRDANLMRIRSRLLRAWWVGLVAKVFVYRMDLPTLERWYLDCPPATTLHCSRVSHARAMAKGTLDYVLVNPDPKHRFEIGEEVSFYRVNYWIGLGTVVDFFRDFVVVHFDRRTMGLGGPPQSADRCYPGEKWRPTLPESLASTSRKVGEPAAASALRLP